MNIYGLSTAGKLDIKISFFVFPFIFLSFYYFCLNLMVQQWSDIFSL